MQENLQDMQPEHGQIILRFIASSELKVENLLFDLRNDEYYEEGFMDRGQFYTEPIDGVEPYQFIEIAHQPSFFWNFSSRIVDSLADNQEYQGDKFFQEMRKKNMEKKGDNQKYFWYEPVSKNRKIAEYKSQCRLFIRQLAQRKVSVHERLHN